MKDIMNSLGFSSCREDLTAAATILNEFQSKPSIFSNLRTTGTWPLKREEIMELVRRIERHKNTINMAAIADNMYPLTPPVHGPLLTSTIDTLPCRYWSI